MNISTWRDSKQKFEITSEKKKEKTCNESPPAVAPITVNVETRTRLHDYFGWPYQVRVNKNYIYMTNKLFIICWLISPIRQSKSSLTGNFSPSYCALYIIYYSVIINIKEYDKPHFNNSIFHYSTISKIAQIRNYFLLRKSSFII